MQRLLLPKPCCRRAALARAAYYSTSSSAQPFFKYELVHQSRKSAARVGRIITPHGVIDTPNFVGVGTNGTLKALDNVMLQTLLSQSGLELQLMFANTFHLLLHPGPDVVAAAGGIHKFIRRDKPIITDSGGFQVFSLAHGYASAEQLAEGDAAYIREDSAHDLSTDRSDGDGQHQQHQQQSVLETGVLDPVSPHAAATAAEGRPVYQRKGKDRSAPVERPKELKGNVFRKDCSQESLVKKIDEDGVVFKSYRDGATLTLTPETSVRAQKALGADIIIPFDELLPMFQVTPERLRASLDRTHRWELRSLEEHLKDPKQQAMYCVLHGSTDRELRRISIEQLCDKEQRFDGTAIGGSLGRDRDEMMDLLSFVMPRIPKDKPNHVLGIADLESVTRFVSLGVDTFDSAYPTRLGRHGNLFTSKVDGDTGRLDPLGFDVFNIRKGQYKTMHDRPIDPRCTCHTCRHYSIAYLHHLFKTREPTYGVLGTLHNVHFLINLMRGVREAILRDEI